MFISNDEFFGPDRRRFMKNVFDGENRRLGGNVNGPERRGYKSIAYDGMNRRDENGSVPGDIASRNATLPQGDAH
jgi:hypothetical protein